MFVYDIQKNNCLCPNICKITTFSFILNLNRILTVAKLPQNGNGNNGKNFHKYGTVFTMTILFCIINEK